MLLVLRTDLHTSGSHAQARAVVARVDAGRGQEDAQFKCRRSQAHASIIAGKRDYRCSTSKAHTNLDGSMQLADVKYAHAHAFSHAMLAGTPAHQYGRGICPRPRPP
eukprot:6207424-Pleurochrysis_carterae.AAC.1